MTDKLIRQIKNNFVAMVDCDHFLKPNQLQKLLDELVEKNYAIIQAQLQIKATDFWTNLENKTLEISHNTPGLKKKLLVKLQMFITN